MKLSLSDIRRNIHLDTDRINRLALAVIFVWFGALKIFGLSPASELVRNLLHMTLPFVSHASFMIFLGVWEVVIGVLFLFPRMTRLAFWLMLVQMITTFGPFVFLPHMVWSGILVPTLEGQYILKNLALMALGYTVYARTRS